ncbi:MAG: hypothetical protein HYT08_02420 [Candidatus Levybacteria bacterium]|nr:hypothetical protein [Candidatus Levybacteria bacterium]
MAPAEIGIFKFGEGSSSAKVHSGDEKKFVAGSIDANVSSSDLSTVVDVTGENLGYLNRLRGGKILSQGYLRDNKKNIFLLDQEGQKLEINGINGTLTVVNTKHNGSTGEIG